MSWLKLFINPTSIPGGRNQEAYAEQLRYLKQVWNEENYGLERLVRLVLCFLQFFYPILLIRNIAGRWGIVGRRLAVETYTLFKFLFPLVVLWTGWFHHRWILFFVVYFLSETFVHILHLIFLFDVHSAAFSYLRSLLLIFMHYAEVTFGFAVIYSAFDVLSRPMDPMSALYFSTVATTTVGFGDIYAKNSAGQAVVMTQLAVCVVFIVVFINYFSHKRSSNS